MLVHTEPSFYLNGTHVQRPYQLSCHLRFKQPEAKLLFFLPFPIQDTESERRWENKGTQCSLCFQRPPPLTKQPFFSLKPFFHLKRIKLKNINGFAVTQRNAGTSTCLPLHHPSSHLFSWGQFPELFSLILL